MLLSPKLIQFVSGHSFPPTSIFQPDLKDKSCDCVHVYLCSRINLKPEKFSITISEYFSEHVIVLSDCYRVYRVCALWHINY